MNMVKPSFVRAIPWVLLISGFVGLVCSLALTYDQIKVWQNPNFRPICNLNPVVSCGSVISSQQGHIFGIPAPITGLILFPVFITFGIVLLAGAKFKQWLWISLEAGVLGGFVYAIWLFLLSTYKVHALCPFCLATDIVVYTSAWYVTLYNIERGFIRLPKRAKAVDLFIRRHHLDILLLWFLALFAFIMHHFWYYYGKHL